MKTLNLEPHPDRGTIQNASALILRVGVITSMLVMLVGLSISFAHRPLSVEYMQRAAFDGRLSTLWRGLREGRGQSVMELGIYLLVFTPIPRVAVSMVLFVLAILMPVPYVVLSPGPTLNTLGTDSDGFGHATLFRAP